MNVFRVAADSSVLIGLSLIKQFDLLKELFHEIYVPYAVYDEVAIKGKGEPGAKEIEIAIKSGWILRRRISSELAVKALTASLSRGEAEVIILCKELDLDYALIDEKTARNAAELLDVNAIGVLGIINLAYKLGFDIDKKKLISQLRDFGFRISDKLYKKMLSD